MSDGMNELAGKVAIITGGGYGIGKQIALAYAKLGAHLVLAARSAGPCRKRERKSRRSARA